MLLRTRFLLRASLRAHAVPRTARTLSAIASEASEETSANTTGSRSVRQRLRETPVPEAVLQRIRKLGLGHERGGAVRLSEDTLRAGRRRELGRLGLLNSATTVSELPLPATAELALAGMLAGTEASPPADCPAVGSTHPSSPHLQVDPTSASRLCSTPSRGSGRPPRPLVGLRRCKTSQA